MSDFESKVRIDIDAGQALATIKALQRQISDFHSSLAKGSATANLKSLQMQQSLIDTINATGQYSAQMKTVASSTQAFTTSLEKNKLSMGQYFKYAGGASKSFGKFFKTEMDTIQKVAVERVKDLQTQYIKMGRDASGALKTIAVRPLALDMENLSTKTQIAAQKQQLLNQLLKQGSTNLLNFGKNTQWAGRQLMVGFTIPLGILGSTAAKTFMDMEKQAIAFKRVYGDTFTPSAETDKMLKQIQDLSSEFTKYGVAVEKTMEQAAKAAATGKMGADLLAQVTESTRLAILGNVDQQQALETTISLTNAFGTSADELRGKINFLNAVENQTVTSIEDLTTAIPKAAPVIKQLGGNVEDLAFFLTAMREGGINASEGANALKSGLASLINPTSKATKMLQGFGINITGIVEKNQGNVKNLVVDFAKALDTLDPLNRARAIEQLFGKFQFSRLSTLFQNVIKDGSQAARVLELTKQSSAELGILAQRELNRISSSPMYKFQKAVADFKKELAPVGEEFIKAVTPLIQFGTDVLKSFNKLDGGVKQFIITTTGVIAGLGPIMLMTFGLIANGVANIIKGFSFVKSVFNKTSTASTVLGETTDYMTQQQIEAAAVAASLEQVHNKLTQSFTVETQAVNNLTTAYLKAVSAQNAFSGSAGGSKKGKAVPKKYASGIFSVPGPKGAGDIIPAMLSPGEAVIPAKPAQKYRGFIKGMIAGNIPGFEVGTADARQKVRAAPSTIIDQVRKLFASGWIGQKQERERMRKIVLAEADAQGLVDTETKKSRSNFLSKYGFGKSGPVDSTHIASSGEDKYFTSKNVLPEHRALNQVFADAVEGRISRDKKTSAIGNVLNNKQLLAKMAAESGLNEKTLVQELKKLDPRRAGGAAYPTTTQGQKALLSFYENTDRKTSGTKIAAAGMKARFSVGDVPGGYFQETKKGGKLRLNPELDAKAIQQQEKRLKDSKKADAKASKAKKANTAAVVADTEETKKGTRVKKDARKTQSKILATPAIATKETVGNGITRHSGVDSRGRAYVKYFDSNGKPLKIADAESRIAGSRGASRTPKGRIKGLLTGLPGKLGLAGLATMGAGAVTGNEQVSSLSDQLFQAAMLSSFIPQGTMDKMKEKFAPMKDKIVNSKIGQSVANSKIGGAIKARYGAGGIVQTAANAFKEKAALSIASKGFMKSMPMMIAGLARVGTKFIPVIGQILLVLDIAFTVLTANARKQEDISKAIVETLSMTKDRLDKINEFFGTDAKLSGLRTATLGSGAVVGEQASLAEQFRKSEQFNALYKDQATKLKGASNQQFAITMQALGIDLMGQGVGEEQVQIIIDAIKKEAGKESVVIKFKDLRIDTETGRKNLAKSLREITSGAIKEYQSNRNFLGFNFEATAKLDEYGAQVAGFLSGLSQEFVNGNITVKEFNSSFGEIADTAKKIEAANPGDGILFLKETMMATNPELAAGMANISDYPTYLSAMNASAKGAAVSFQLLADAASSIPEIQAGAKEYLDYLNDFQDQKNLDIQKQRKLISGLTTQQKNLQKQEEQINDTYDKRIKALERIDALNQSISNRQKSQLDLADALSQGDVFRAAQAMQQIRADQAALALQQQKNALEDQKDKKTGSLQDKQDNLSGSIDSANTQLQSIMNKQADAYKPSQNAINFTGAIDKLWETFGWIWNLTHFWLPEAEKKTSFYQEAGNEIKAVYKMFPGLFPQGKATGGYISGPGSGTSDSIPARLSNGEYVIRAKAVSAIGTDALDKLNHAEKFAKGGYVSSGVPKKKSWEENTLDWFSGLGKSIAELPVIKQFGEYYMKENDFGSGALRALFGTLALPANLIGGGVNSALKAIALGQKGNVSGMFGELLGGNTIKNALASSYSGVLDPKLTQSSQFDAAAQTVIDNKMFGADTKAGVARARLVGGALNFLGDPTMYLGVGAVGKIASIAKVAAKAKTAKVAKPFTGMGSNTELNKIVSSTFTKRNIKVGEDLYPTYNVGKGKFAFQGYNQKLPGVLSATGVKVVPMTPEGLLEAAIGLNPKDKTLKVMLKNFKENKIGQKELDLLDNIHASVSINKKGRITEFERADGLATMLSALSGNKTAKGIIDFKTQKLKDIVSAQDARKADIFETYDKNKLVGDGQIAVPANVPFVRSLQGPLDIDKNGNALVYSASNYRGDYARASIHGTTDAIVGNHASGAWDPMATKIVSPLSQMIRTNGLPRSMDVADTWWLRNPGQPLVFPKGAYSQIHSFDSNAKLSAELVKRGIIKPGATVPIISSDPATKEVFRLIKTNVEDYTEAQQELLFSQYRQGLLPGYNILDTLDRIALDVAKRQHGIVTGHQGSLNGDIFSNTARSQEINNLATSLGVRSTGSKAHSNSTEEISEKAIYSLGKNNKTAEARSQSSGIDALELIRTNARLGHFKGQVINPRLKESRSERMSGFRKGITNLAKGGMVNVPQFKTGGMFHTGYADGGLAMLHDKEFVMNAGAVKDYGVNNLKAMNNGTYNNGSVYNSYGVNINVGGSNSNASDIARTVIREIKKIDSQQIRSTGI